MRTSLVVIGAAVAALVSGCGETTQSQSGEPSEVVESSSTESAVALPPEPKPETERECPYLDTEFVAQTNGQRVGSVKTSADDTNPACFFYRPDGDVQLTVRVYEGEEEVARALVDDAAPVATSNPTSQPTGWEGGYESRDDGAVYAVSKEGYAVVVTTNQQQSVKARTVAIEAITRLGF
ncbi:DUF2020 domain-containing protein [Saccharomonospora glauca]|uniref:DUF2020 domain-containing protein n=1 Tax=Saccharomonospora glauca K62 TaxID=928724 RepID=I1CWG8_9PSEU|nr:DUF2020 domain-containing protein [Saccharomonospora glauca]EIE97042.1 protein of unknown function (DUF2020) [Saccharomonospora glauca K62]